MAHQLWLEARDQDAQLHYDSALALYRAARSADPGWLPPHLGYFAIMDNRYRHAEVQREYAALAGADAVHACLAVVRNADADEVNAMAALQAVERASGPSSCTAYHLLLAAFRNRNPPDFDAAIRYGRQATRQVPEPAQGWLSLAAAFASTGRFDEASRTLDEGLRRVEHPLDRLELYLAQVQFHSAHGDSARAAALIRSVRAAVERDGRPGLRLRYNEALPAPGDTSSAGARATWHYEEATRLAEASGSLDVAWGAARSYGHALVDSGQPGRAVAYQARAMTLARQAGNTGWEMISLVERGRAYDKLGRLGDATADLERAVRIGAGHKPPYEIAQAWHNLAHAYEGAGRLADATRAADRFIALSAGIDDPISVMSLHDAGLIRWKAGWHAAAEAAFDAMVRRVDQIRTEVYWAGEYYERRGDLPAALRYYRTGADRQDDPAAFRGLARVYSALGQFDSAESAARHHDRRLAAWTPVDAPLLPEILARRGRTDVAVRTARAWAQRQAAGGNVEGAALARLQVAELLLSAREDSAALREATAADSLARRLNLTDVTIEAGRLRGQALGRMGDAAGARQALETAAAVAAAHPTADGVLRTQTALGDVLAGTSPAAALAAYDRAARAVEHTTVSLDLDIQRAGYREEHLAPFDGAVRTLLAAPPGADQLDALLRWSARRKGAGFTLATALRPPGAGDPAALPGVAGIRRALAPGDAFIDYLALDSSIVAFVVTPRLARLVRLPATPRAVQQMTDTLRAGFTAYAGRVDLARAPFDVNLAARLFDALVGPLRPALLGARRLLVAPDGVLHEVPFEALVVTPAASADDYAGAHYLLDDAAVVYLPSARPFAAPAPRPAAATGRLLAVQRGVPGGTEELTGVRASWRGPVQVLDGAAATEAAVRTALAGADIAHFAVHARADTRDPLASYLALGPDSLDDGLFHLNEAAATRLRARLVVLSACETQAGRVYRGEGTMSLARGFVSGGAGMVVATRWPVGPETAGLMARFYAGLAAGTAPDAALHAARVAMRHDPRTAHPFFWGAFVVVRGR